MQIEEYTDIVSHNKLDNFNFKQKLDNFKRNKLFPKAKPIKKKDNHFSGLQEMKELLRKKEFQTLLRDSL